MPYISKELVKAYRDQIRKEFPEYKISVVRQHNMKVDVRILSGPIDLLPNTTEKYHCVNHFYIKEHYSDCAEAVRLLSRIKEILNRDNGTLVIDGDYGAVPHYYIGIHIGYWDKPYEIKNKK